MAFFILYTDMPEESKEWINIDYITTQQYKTIEAWKEEARKVELVLEYPQDFPHSEINQLKRLKKLDSIVKPEKGPIRKVIYSISRQPIKTLGKYGKPIMKDCLFYNGYYYGFKWTGEEIKAEFSEGYYKKPKMKFQYDDNNNPNDPETGKSIGKHKVQGVTFEHYIELPTNNAKERRRFIEDLIAKCPGTSIELLAGGSHLYYRTPAQDNSHYGTRQTGYSWDQFCDSDLKTLGELQKIPC